MIIAIEGHDGVGKTTLAKDLSKALNFEYVKHPAKTIFGLAEVDFANILKNVIAYDNSTLTAWLLAFNDMFALEHFKNKNVILDRFVLLNYFWNGNTVTEPIFNLSLSLFNKPDLIILLTASIETRLDRIKNRNPDDKDLNNKTICNATDTKLIRFLNKYHYNYLKINTDNKTEEQVLNEAINSPKLKNSISK